METRKYYEAYEDRYQVAHAAGIRWFGDAVSPIVGQILEKYGIRKTDKLLELGCGEGRDAIPLLEAGFDLLATDISSAAITHCRKQLPHKVERFALLNCVAGSLAQKFDFLYAVAVVHMLVEDEDRDGFYRFIGAHLEENGLALICSMGDGSMQMQSDVTKAFTLQPRQCGEKTLMVAGTSCRMVTQAQFAEEMQRNGLQILEMGQTCIPEQFPEMMYAVVKRNA